MAGETTTAPFAGADCELDRNCQRGDRPAVRMAVLLHMLDAGLGRPDLVLQAGDEPGAGGGLERQVAAILRIAGEVDPRGGPGHRMAGEGGGMVGVTRPARLAADIVRGGETNLAADVPAGRSSLATGLLRNCSTGGAFQTSRKPTQRPRPIPISRAIPTISGLDETCDLSPLGTRRAPPRHPRRPLSLLHSAIRPDDSKIDRSRMFRQAECEQRLVGGAARPSREMLHERPVGRGHGHFRPDRGAVRVPPRRRTFSQCPRASRSAGAQSSSWFTTARSRSPSSSKSAEATARRDGGVSDRDRHRRSGRASVLGRHRRRAGLACATCRR